MATWRLPEGLAGNGCASRAWKGALVGVCLPRRGRRQLCYALAAMRAFLFACADFLSSWGGGFRGRPNGSAKERGFVRETVFERAGDGLLS